jgi:hypothetical protein
MSREVFDPNATDGDGDGLVQDGTKWERPVGTQPEGFDAEATDGDGDGLVQDGTPFERAVEPVVEEVVEEAKEDSVIKADEPVESQPAISDVADGVIGSGSSKKKPAAPKIQKPEGEKVALFSEKNIYWEGVGRLSKGYSIVDAEDSEKWLSRSFIRLATPEEIKQEFGN